MVQSSDQLSPVMEGFENPTMATLFQQMLKITPKSIKKSRGPKIPITTSSDGSCPPKVIPTNNVPSGSGSEGVPEKIAFLKSILKEQKETADSLMESAKKMGPVTQQIVANTGAYDAAFESDIVSPLPSMSGTLQGFTIFFFFISFLSLAIVASIMTNQVTGNLQTAMKTFGGFMAVLFVSIGLIATFG